MIFAVIPTATQGILFREDMLADVSVGCLCLNAFGIPDTVLLKMIKYLSVIQCN
jgi:hypothetical protein